MKALLIGNANRKTDDISAAQLYPFFDNRNRLRRELGLELRHRQANTFAEIAEVCKGAKADVLFIRPSWQQDPDEAVATMEKIRREHPTQQIIFIDPWDQTSSRFFGVLPYVDWFLKYQRLKDVSLYRQNFIGGTLLTDYLVRERGYDLKGWHVGSEVPEGLEHRIGTAWNVSVTERFKSELLNQSLFDRLKPKFQKPIKDIDLFCRASCGSIKKLEWYGRYRQECIDILDRLKADYKLAVFAEYDETGRAPSQQYFSEIRRSRAVFAPFGWGETTWRDYEAICYGDLLIKPQMDHVDTKPFIYYANETYVPIKWDLSDLEEKCRYYLDHPEEANRIIQNARQVFKSYFTEGEFIKTIRSYVSV